MTTQNLTSPSKKGGLKDSLIEFPDNRLLIDLCGAYDQHLAAIEKALDVQIIRRGNQLAILGSAAGLDEVTEILKALYQRLEAGRTIEPGDIDRELRMQGDGENGVDRKVDQLEMFSGEKFEIKTRKKIIEPRTDAQKAYVASLFSNELAFGIGPAGTGKTYLAVAVGVSMLEKKCRLTSSRLLHCIFLFYYVLE